MELGLMARSSQDKTPGIVIPRHFGKATSAQKKTRKARDIGRQKKVPRGWDVRCELCGELVSEEPCLACQLRVGLVPDTTKRKSGSASRKLTAARKARKKRK